MRRRFLLQVLPLTLGISKCLPISFTAGTRDSYTAPQRHSTPTFARNAPLLLQRLLPDGVPTLVTAAPRHHDDSGEARRRWRRALPPRPIAPSVRGFLVPGSTGDGWRLSDGEARELSNW